MDESRKQFEKWFPEMVEDMPPGMVEVFDKMLFMAWQASRTAIEIELPDVEDPANFFCEVYDTYKVQPAINSAGIKVKGA